MQPKDLSKEQRKIYDRHYKDLVEPDEVDRETCMQIAILVNQIQTMTAEIENTGLLVQHTGDKGQTITRVNPLQGSLDRVQKTLTAQLKALGTRQDSRKKAIQQEEFELAKLKLEYGVDDDEL